MPITLITGPANAGKAQVVMDAVRAHLAHGEEPLLVVPTRADVEHYLRELAGRGRGDGRAGGALRRADRRGRAPRGRQRGRCSAGSRASGCSRRSLALDGATPRDAAARRGWCARSATLLAELQVRRVTPGAAAGGARRAGRPRTGRRPARAELGAAVRGVPRARSSGSGASTASSARCARSTRCGASPALWGAHAGAVLRLRRSRRRCSSTRSRRSAGWSDAPVTVSLDLRARAGRVRRARRDVRSAARRSPPSTAQLQPRAELLRAAARAPRSHHLERSLFEPGARARGPRRRGAAAGGRRRARRARAGRAARSARCCDDGHAGGGDRGRACARPGAMRGPARGGVRARPGSRSRCERRRPLRRHGDRARADRAAALRAAPTATRGELGDLLAWLRAPGLLERPELADALEVTRAAQRVRRAPRGRGRCGRSATGRWRRSTSSREAAERGPGGADRARGARARVAVRGARGAAARRARRATSSTRRARWRRARARWPSCASWRGRRPSSRPATAPSSRERSSASRSFSGERPGAGAVAVLDPLALRARRVRALFLCGLQEGVFPARARPAAAARRGGARRLAETSGLRLGRAARTRWRPSATCCTRPSRARRSCSC